MNIDELVATYAPIGARNKRQKRLKKLGFAAGALSIAALGVAFTVSGLSISERIAGLLPQQTVRADDEQRAEFAARLAELESKLEKVQRQERELEDQGLKLARLLAETDSEHQELELRQDQGSQLDEEIAAIAAQRKALEKRWAQFEAQGELLAMQIMAINAQRKELEAQRLQIDLQRRELDDLLERGRTLTPNKHHSTAASTATEDHTYNSLVVDNSELDDMRGGFSIGDGLDVSFGFAQTGSINGIEQFTNSFTIDSVGSGFDNIDMSNMNSVILQNGDGNFVSASVIDALSDSFGNIIQNTLNDQVISTTTTFDIGLHNVPGTMQGLAGEQALHDSLGSFR